MADTDRREAFARGIPKAELHLHIEGTLEPELMFEAAARNDVFLPYETVDEVKTAYEFTDLQSFLDIYYRGTGALRTKRDFADLLSAYLERAAADNVRHAEIFFDPQTHTGRGVDFDVFMSGFAQAREDTGERLGISTELIMCFLRHLPEEEAMATLETAEPFLDQVTAVGLDSSEVGHPPEKFERVFAKARSLGLRAVAHAGEEGPSEYVRGALDRLHVERIDHGVRVEDDPELLARIVAARTPLTMCPLSNVKLRVFDRLEDHNLRRLLEAGAKVTINSDDPAYFGGYVADNYAATAAALDLSREQIRQIARNSFEASFLSEAARGAFLAEVDAFS